MKTQYLFNVAAGLLALAALMGNPAVAQNAANPNITRQQTKSKVPAALLELTPSGAGLARQRPVAGALPLQLADGLQVEGNYVAIEAVAAPAEAGRKADARQLLADLESLGLRDGSFSGAMVAGLFPIKRLPELEKLRSLHSVRPAYQPAVEVGSTTSQGDAALRADVARNRFSVSGEGVKVGILSDSYNLLGGADAGVASGDLPENGVEVLEDNDNPLNLDEGRAMAEIVHDVAPGAAIAFRTATRNQLDFAQGIRDLFYNAGCRVIVDDIRYASEPFFQNGVIGQAAEEAVRGGAVYLCSGGNAAQRSYESGFNNAGEIAGVAGVTGEAHAFSGGDTRQTIRIAPGRRVVLTLQWDQPFFSLNGVRGAETDLNLYLLFNGQVVRSSTNPNVSADPIETVVLTNPNSVSVNVEVVITKVEGPDPGLIKWVNTGGSDPLFVEYDTQSPTVLGRANAGLVLAVAAAPYFDPSEVESFSSLGGAPLLFDDEGNRLEAPIVYGKPDLTGPDGGNNTFFGSDYEDDGFPNFFGTSASAPHVAAVCALILQANRNYSPTDVRNLLQATATDLDNPLTPDFDEGFDFKTGAGFVQADAALKALFGTISTRQGVASAKAPADLQVSCYPNPASGRVTFQVEALGNQPITLTVVDRMGREVLRSEGTKRLATTKDCSALPKGLYVAKVQTGKAVKTRLLQIE